MDGQSGDHIKLQLSRRKLCKQPKNQRRSFEIDIHDIFLFFRPFVLQDAFKQRRKRVFSQTIKWMPGASLSRLCTLGHKF